MVHVRNAGSILGLLVLVFLAAFAIIGAFHLGKYDGCRTYEDGSYACQDGTTGCLEGGLCND